MFDLAATVTRIDNHGSHNVRQETTTSTPPWPSTHPKSEAAQYDIDITYPDADGERTISHVLFCRSDADQATCERFAPSAEKDVDR